MLWVLAGLAHLCYTEGLEHSSALVVQWRSGVFFVLEYLLANALILYIWKKPCLSHG